MLCKWPGPRDVELLKSFALEEAEKAAEKAQLDSDKELWSFERYAPMSLHYA